GKSIHTGHFGIEACRVVGIQTLRVVIPVVVRVIERERHRQDEPAERQKAEQRDCNESSAVHGRLTPKGGQSFPNIERSALPLPPASPAPCPAPPPPPPAPRTGRRSP